MEDLEYATTRTGKHVAFRRYSGGRGEPLLYLPGLLYSIESIPDDPPYVRLIDGLADLRPLVLVERSGVGASDPVDFSQDIWEQWADDVVAVIDHLGVERASLMGSIVGADIALETAARFPKRVASVVALHPRAVRAEVDHDAGRDRMLMVVERDADAGRDEMARSAPSRVSEPGFVDWFVRAGRTAASPGSAARFWEAVARPSSLGERVGSIEGPVLLLCRRHYTDFGRGADELGEFASQIPGGKCVVLEGADGLVNSGDVEGLVFEVAEFLVGEAHTVSTSRLLASLLFTDLVSSTATARSMGDADWRTVLDHHDRLIDRTVRRYGGTMVKATGDGALITFETPSRALQCAIALRAQLGGVGLGVRMGVHLGEIEGRGADIAGVAVHLAARVMSAAGAGEILTTVAVPLATLGSAFGFESRGSYELKGFEQEFELFRVVEEG